MLICLSRGGLACTSGGASGQGGSGNRCSLSSASSLILIPQLHAHPVSQQQQQQHQQQLEAANRSSGGSDKGIPPTLFLPPPPRHPPPHNKSNSNVQQKVPLLGAEALQQSEAARLVNEAAAVTIPLIEQHSQVPPLSDLYSKVRILEM